MLCLISGVLLLLASINFSTRHNQRPGEPTQGKEVADVLRARATTSTSSASPFPSATPSLFLSICCILSAKYFGLDHLPTLRLHR